MRVRDYRREDAEAIVRLFFETVRAVNLGDYSPEQVAAWAPAVPDAQEWHRRMAGRCTLVVEEGDAVIAFAELEPDGRIDMLYCHKDAVGRGVGSMLYAEVEERARALGVSRLITEASLTAEPFFARKGFRVVRRQRVERLGVALPNAVMVKDLAR